MITILTTTEHKVQISKFINSVDRLNELVDVLCNQGAVQLDSKLILVEDDLIKLTIEWYDKEPPFLFPEIDFNKDNLLGVIFYKLGNHQRAFNYIAENNSLFNDILTVTHLQFGYEISEEMYTALDNLHNKCIVMQYGNYVSSVNSEELEKMYLKAIEISENDEAKGFTTKHYVNYLIDHAKFKKAENIVRSLQTIAISEEANINLDILLASSIMAQLEIPYDTEKLDEISALYQKGISFYESKDQMVNAGLLYIEASEVANFQNDFTASKDYINKAILIFKDADIPEFLGEAGLRKATLLYTWSKNGSPQYYKPAINAFQDTLKVFKKETHPQKFADVHHNLALIYSEIPVSPEEKPIWTAFCASSFKEVLKFYTKDKYPYEFAMASHNYATALMSFPEAKLHNNLDKAFNMFEDTLSVRTADAYPFERALTLINQLELYWIMHNENKEEETKRFNTMFEKVNEIFELVDDKNILDQASEHLEALQNLKKVLN
ncbi:MAG: hypothetical protein GVY05_03545 [Bacteroidetes bacterium]|jgi:hypothetical protein|nr:hypothetical protein [Bacteroidota bacterium]